VFGLAQLVIALPLHALLLRRHPEDLGLVPDGEPALLYTTHAPSSGATPLRGARAAQSFWMLTVSLALVLLGSTVVFITRSAFMISRGTGAVLAATLSGMLGLASLPGRYVFNVLSTPRQRAEVAGPERGGTGVGIVVLVLVIITCLAHPLCSDLRIRLWCFSPLRAR